MKKTEAIGVIAEYNPFHNGHAYHLEVSRKNLGDLPVIAIMSGNFVQRGQPALADKWNRAACAVQNGVDLVLELPVIFACRSAEHFAQGAVKILQATGCVKYLSFGCEEAELELLKHVASIPLPPFSEQFAEKIKSGRSYAQIISEVISSDDKKLLSILQQPNNILGIEYLRQLTKLHSDIIPFTVTRHGAAHHDTGLNGQFAGASAIRRTCLSSGLDSIRQVIPPATYKFLSALSARSHVGIDQDTLDLLLMYKLRQASPQSIAACTECSEGLENKIFRAAGKNSLEEIVGTIKSKRYPATRINRLLIQFLLANETVNFRSARAADPSYLRILAFNKRGRNLLKEMKATATLPLLNKIDKALFRASPHTDRFRASLKLDLAATDLYNLLQPGNRLYGADYLNQPHYFDE